MGRTQLTSREIGSIQKNDHDITTTGEATITKLIIAGNGAPSMGQTGIDAGTGDVTLTFTGGQLTGKVASDANSTYTDATSYWGEVTLANGWPATGFLTGQRNGTANAQKLQDEVTATTYTRVWLNGASAWSAWNIYVDDDLSEILTTRYAMP